VGLALLGIVFAYLALTLAFSLLTPAGEANDELDHVIYTEHLLRDSAFPHISADNGHESHQPPLYYLIAAGWQKLLGVRPFELVLGPATTIKPGAPPLELSHTYTRAQHQAAVHVHELRLLSVLFGLGTVLLTFVAARLATNRDNIALASALSVALWPKEVVVSSVVTNDSLVIALGSLALVLLLLWLRAGASDVVRSRWLAGVLGVVLGLAVLTKFSALPLVAVAVVIMAGVVLRRDRRLRSIRFLEPALVLVGCLAVSGWWFLRNKHLYGEYLAVKASNAYMRAWLPPLIQPVSWLNSGRFLHFVPASLQRSVWYDGGWNQFLLPFWLNKVLIALAAYAVVLFIWSVARGRDRLLRPAVTAALVGAVVAGVMAVMSVAKDALQAEARVAFVGLSAFATILVIGASQAGLLLLRRARPALAVAVAEVGGLLLWPVVFLGIDLYVFLHFVWPTRGL
jgi:4-amino-4-deoxy-L-arabinose transferase-like glycosyltransferase